MITSLDFNYVKPCLDLVGTTLTSTINFMTRGFDDLTLTFYKTKLYDHDKDNW